MDYSKLSDQEINGLVMDALSDGNQAYRNGDGSFIELLHLVNAVEFGEHVERDEVYATFDPCNKPADSWPIIFENKVMLSPRCADDEWNAQIHLGRDGIFDEYASAWHKNPLRAAMIVFLMMQESQHA
ncbi:phage protein NinX family protein [Cronobacter dublinensis]|uniref:phage protein NinX family protein n=1 Tax=Cronobacter dublinensis TaxID=413497 RepID=UPI00300E3F0D